MNAEVRQIKTAAEIGLAQAFAAAKSRLPGAPKIAAMREAAFGRFDVLGLPHRRIEEWKYTDLRALMRDAKPLASLPDAAAKERAGKAGRLLAGIESRRLVFADGAFVPELSDLTALEPGLSIRSTAEALADGDPRVVARIGQVCPAENDAAVALNTALMGDGAVILLAAGAALERPLHLVFAATGEKPASMFMRSLAVIEPGARVMIVESHEGAGARDYQSNTAMEIAVGDRAHVDHVKITDESAAALHVSTLMASVGAQARFREFTFNVGGANVRNQLFVRMNGEGSIIGLAGATLLLSSQHVDTTLVADHAVGGCQSRETFKSVLDDRSHSVFQGKIIVRPDAQKTDARMMTQALLLSEDAEADNKPELEIFADDVQCGHGATAGALDEDLLFYLRARGIPAREAEALLIQAFVGDAVESIEHAGVRDALMESVAAWLKARR